MEYQYRLYRKANGDCPVKNLLDELLTRNESAHALVVAGLRRMRFQHLHGEPLTKSLRPQWDLFELRAGGARIFWIYRPKQLIVLLDGIAYKGQRKLPRRVLKVVDGCRLDYLARCTGDENDYDETPEER